MPKKTVSRKAAARNVVFLATALHEQGIQRMAFECSEAFQTTLHCPDLEEPLDTVKWNPKTLRYEMENGNRSGDFVMDDAFLQAMVMFFLLYRAQHGWTQKDLCSQLSIWPKDHPKVPNQSSLPNHWGLERQRLIRDKKLGKTTMNHIQNWNTICSVYSSEGIWPNENRKAKSNFGSMHMLMEQSCIQWALAQRETDPDLSELVVLILKLLLQFDYNSPQELIALAYALSKILLKDGEKDEPESFSKRALVAIERLDIEQELADFDTVEFEEQRLKLVKEPLHSQLKRLLV